MINVFLKVKFKAKEGSDKMISINSVGISAIFMRLCDYSTDKGYNTYKHINIQGENGSVGC